VSDKIACAHCGTDYTPTQKAPDRQLCCSPKCYFSHRYYRDKDKRQFDREFRCSKLCSAAKSRAKKFDREFDIDKEFVLGLWDHQGGKCAITNKSFNLDYYEGGPHPDGPSLDRIDSSLGYVPSNVRLVTYHTNTALSCFGEDMLVKLALSIIQNIKEN
jgi:hypothetical protein